MAQTSKVMNGISILELEEIVIGSEFKIAALFERLVSEDPDVYEPIDFTGMTIKADVKDRPSKEVEPDTTFVCVPRAEAGWIDFSLDGTATGLLKQKTYYASVKVWPTDSPEKGDTLLVIQMPMKYKATR